MPVLVKSPIEVTTLPHSVTPGPGLSKRKPSRMKKVFVISFTCLFFFLLIFLILHLTAHDFFKKDQFPVDVISEDVVSINEGSLPAESHFFNKKTTWKGWGKTVIFISLDGFRYEYLSRKQVSNLKYLADKGISSAMYPIFPTVTFPNHISMVTGMFPDEHGIINNVFYDHSLQDFFDYKKGTRNDLKWWKSIPIWNLVQDFNLASAVSFWPGSSAPIGGRLPNHLIRYQSDYKIEKFIEDILKWLDYHTSTRPTFIASYIPTIDTIGHLYGPNSRQMDDALSEVDNAIGTLINGLKERNIFDDINLVIVSDHGMASVNSKHIIYAEDIFNLNLTHSIYFGPVSFIRTLSDDFIGEVYSRLEAYSFKYGTFKVYLRTTLPPEWNYGKNDRIAQIIVVCEPSYYFSSRTSTPPPVGDHGYPLPNKDMEAIFIAHGSRIRKRNEMGINTLDPFLCLDLFPFLCKLMDFTPPLNNGTSYLIDTLMISA